MKRKSRFRPLLAGVALALALQPAAAGWGTANEAKAAAAKEWRDVGSFGASFSTQDATLVFAEDSLWFARASADRLIVDRLTHGVWSRESDDDQGAIGIREFDFALAPGGRPTVAYMDAYSQEVVVRQQQDGGKTWSGVGGPLPSVGRGSKPMLASDSSGRIWLAISDSNQGGRATVGALENGAWGSLEIVTGGNASMPNIAIDAQGQPAVAFFDAASGFYNPIVKSRSASGEWRDIGSLNPWGNYPDLQSASDGSLYLCYNSGNGTNNQNIVWRRSAAGEWGQIGQFPGYLGKMAIDPTDGYPVVAYRETNDPGGWLHAVKWDGASWTEIGSLGIRDYAYDRLMLIAVGDDGTPYISYTDSNGNLHVAGYADWTPPTLVKTQPAYGVENFDPRDDLRLTFSKPVTPVAGKTISVCDLHGLCDDIDAAGDRVTIRGATVEIRPDGQWPEGATLSVAIEAEAFQDANGSPYAGLPEGGWRFTLKVLPKPPGMPSVAASPLDGGAEVTVVPNEDSAWSVTKVRVLVYDAEAGKVKEAEAAADPQQPTKMVVEGLENGKAYRFGAQTQNVNGWSAESERTDPVIPRGKPQPPREVNGTAGFEAATVTFEPPASDGGSEIDLYRVRLVRDGTEVAAADLPADQRTYTWERLEKEAEYDVQVAAGNAQGLSDFASATVVPYGAPDAPTGVTADAGDGKATVTFAAPARDGGLPIKGYAVTAWAGDEEEKTIVSEGESTTVTVDGLANGTAYTFTVKAVNAGGESEASSPSNEVTPSAPDTTTVPAAPAGVTAVAGDGKATLTFTAPANDGGLPIRGYIVTAWIGETEAKTIISEGQSTSVKVDGLINGTAYTFTVKAVNAKGESEASAPSNEVTPSVPDTTNVPHAPTGVTAAAGDGKATVTFAAPTNDGGLPIQGYVVTAWIGDTEAKTIVSEGPSTSVTADGLINGTAYTFTVKAVNAKGASEASSPSNEVTPTAGSGGNPGNGGEPGHGGDPGSGGNPGSGGEPGHGGDPGSGGNPGNGGEPGHGGDPGPGPGSGGGGSGSTSPADPGQAYATAKAGSLALGTLPVRLEKNAGGELAQTLTISDDWVREAVAKLRAAGLASLDIMLDDKPSQPDIRVIRLSAAAASLLADAGIALGILTPEAGVRMPPASLTGATVPIEWELRPLRGEAAGRSLAARAAASQAVVAAAGKGTVHAIGAPIDIRTTLQGRAIEVALPLGSSGLTGLPRDTGVYIEHGDGKTELVQGRIAALGDQSAIAFDVNHFRTLGIVEIAGWFDAAGQTPHDSGTAYMSGYPDRTFKPNSGVNRAEMAVMLTRLLGAADPGAAAGFRDVAPSNWAVSGISAVAARGWMKGYPDGTFRPDAKLTRAEMAALLAVLAPKQGQAPDQTDNLPFSDVRGHWAEAVILQAHRNGYLKGYADGTFQPDRILTRAEAAVILNQLVGREPASSDQSRYADVPTGHWAYGAIQAASKPE